MDVPIPSLVFALGGKSLLNWAVVLAQRRNMDSFLGTFCVSLALMDTLISLAITAIFTLSDLSLVGLRLTRYHICLLVQITCLVYGVLQWPVVLLASLDHYCTLTPWLRPAGWTRWLGYTTVTCLVWGSALLYILGGPPTSQLLRPDFGPQSHLLLQKCWVPRGPQSSQVGALVLLSVAGALLWCGVVLALHRNGLAWPWRGLYCGLAVFLRTWYAFMGLLGALFLLRVDVPGFLDMNVPWLCFLNSFLIWGMSVLWPRGVCHQGDSVYLDGCCQWRSLGAPPTDMDVSTDERSAKGGSA